VIRDDAAMTAVDRVVNVAEHLSRAAAAHPDRRAIVWTRGYAADGSARYDHWTFAELNAACDRLAAGLAAVGIAQGMRTILMVRPSPEFFALTFALYRLGAVPVLIDPGMGRRHMARCLAKIEAEAFIGVPIAHLFRILHPSAFHSVRIRVTVGRRWLWRGHSLSELNAIRNVSFEPAVTRADDPAAIIFTTGSTGPPKAVLYRHGMFDAQVRLLRDHFKIEPGEIDLPTFPLFALFDPALGMTAVIPDMDPTRPAFVDPARIIRTIHDQAVTHMFGSPALLRRVADYGVAHGIKLPTVRRVISAGAAALPETLERFSGMLKPDGLIHTPYGATEALPVASIASDEILAETAIATSRGEGVCVGRPIPGVDVRIIPIRDEPIPRWDDTLAQPAGTIGEIVVKGPVVTREYLADDDANRLAKMQVDRGVWHRMGDVGYFDAQGRLWFCGRKAHRVVTREGVLFTETCEAIFNQHPAVFRAALVGIGPRGDQQPVVCIELKLVHRRADRETLRRELLALAAQNERTRTIRTLLFHPRFPVDIRHNSKIFREQLAVWAAMVLR
jgi:acyl-coenzyme A synthetase/AMP-(fatty) acid ligase